MSFYEHLDELRARLVKCAFVFAVGFGIAYFFADPILGFLRAPLFRVLPEAKQQLYYTNLFEAFLVHLKIAGYASLVAFSPYYFYQLWAFIAPGLYPKERKFVVPFVTAASAFFIGGALFAYFVLFPAAFKFFVEYGGKSEVPLLTMDSYYGTALKLMLLFGLAFELPVLVCLLGYLGVVDAPTLRAQRKGAILGITFASAIFAPPDAVSMIILMAPLVLLYEGSILVVQAFGRRRAAPPPQAPGGDDDDNPLTGRSRG